MDDLAPMILKISVMAIPALVAITFHEAAHGYVAKRLGDPTAYMLGRVTFNPFRHIDPVGTVLLPLVLFLTSGLLFGWAKPVPVDFRNLHNPRRDMVWVALAGPGVNIALALVSALLMHVAPYMPDFAATWFFENLQISIYFNLVLAVFNMLPLPPLDGGRVAVGLLPDALARPLAGLERYGMLILLGLIFLIPLVAGQLGYAFNPVFMVISPITEALFDLVVRVTGLA